MFSIKLSQTVFEGFPDFGQLDQADERKTLLLKLTLAPGSYGYSVAKFPLPRRERLGFG